MPRSQPNLMLSTFADDVLCLQITCMHEAIGNACVPFLTRHWIVFSDGGGVKIQNTERLFSHSRLSLFCYLFSLCAQRGGKNSHSFIQACRLWLFALRRRRGARSRFECGVCTIFLYYLKSKHRVCMRDEESCRCCARCCQIKKRHRHWIFAPTCNGCRFNSHNDNALASQCM